MALPPLDSSFETGASNHAVRTLIMNGPPSVWSLNLRNSSVITPSGLL